MTWTKEQEIQFKTSKIMEVIEGHTMDWTNKYLNRLQEDSYDPRLCNYHKSQLTIKKNKLKNAEKDARKDCAPHWLKRKGDKVAFEKCVKAVIERTKREIPKQIETTQKNIKYHCGRAGMTTEKKEVVDIYLDQLQEGMLKDAGCEAARRGLIKVGDILKKQKAALKACKQANPKDRSKCKSIEDKATTAYKVYIAWDKKMDAACKDR